MRQLAILALCAPVPQVGVIDNAAWGRSVPDCPSQLHDFYRKSREVARFLATTSNASGIDWALATAPWVVHAGVLVHFCLGG